MADNGIKFVTGIENKVNDQVARAIQQSRGGINAMFNPQIQKQTKRFVDDLTKSFKSMGMDMAKMDKLIQNSFGKQLKEGKKGMDALAESHKKLLKQQETYDKLVRGLEKNKSRYIDRATIRGVYAGMSNETANERAHAQWQAKLNSYSQGSAAIGQAVVENQQLAMQAQQDAHAQRMLRWARNSQLAGVGIAAAGQIIGGAVSLPGQNYQNTANAASFGRGLYARLASGSAEGAVDIGTMMRGNAAEVIRSLAADAVTGHNVRSGTQIGVGGATTVGGVAMSTTGVGAALGGGTAAVGGAGQMVQGGFNFANNSAEAARAQQASAILAASKTLDNPQAQAALAWAAGNSGLWAHRSKTGRGDWDMFSRIAEDAAGSGVDQGTALSIYDRAASVLGHAPKGFKGALHVGFGANELYDKYGLDAATGGGAMAGIASSRNFFGLGQGASTAQAKRELEDVMARATRRGFTDKSVVEAIVSQIGASSFARGDMSGMMDLAAMGMRAGGSSVLEQKMAADSIERQNAFYANSGGYYGARGFQAAGKAMRAVGMTQGPMVGVVQNLLGTSNLSDLVGGNKYLSTIIGDEGLANNLIKSTIESRQADLISRSPGLQARLAELRKDPANKYKSDKELLAMIVNSTGGADQKVMAAGGALYAAERGLYTPGGQIDIAAGQSQFTRDMRLFSGESVESVTAGDRKGAEVGPGGNEEALNKAQLKAQLDTIKGAAQLFTESIKTVADTWEIWQRVARQNEGVDEIFRKAAIELNNMATAAGKLARPGP
jgi:hypothetical protein